LSVTLRDSSGSREKGALVLCLPNTRSRRPSHSPRPVRPRSVEVPVSQLRGSGARAGLCGVSRRAALRGGKRPVLPFPHRPAATAPVVLAPAISGVRNERCPRVSRLASCRAARRKRVDSRFTWADRTPCWRVLGSRTRWPGDSDATRPQCPRRATVRRGRVLPRPAPAGSDRPPHVRRDAIPQASCGSASASYGLTTSRSRRCFACRNCPPGPSRSRRRTGRLDVEGEVRSGGAVPRFLDAVRTTRSSSTAAPRPSAYRTDGYGQEPMSSSNWRKRSGRPVPDRY